jgi:hypothetical protein
MIKNNIVTYAVICGGALLALVGLLGMHFHPVMSLVHLGSGVLGLYFGLKSTSLLAARTFCQGIGVLYALAGLAGMVDELAIGSGEFGLQIVQHASHLIVGVGFIAAAIIQPMRPALPSPYFKH